MSETVQIQTASKMKISATNKVRTAQRLFITMMRQGDRTLDEALEETQITRSLLGKWTRSRTFRQMVRKDGFKCLRFIGKIEETLRQAAAVHKNAQWVQKAKQTGRNQAKMNEQAKPKPQERNPAPIKGKSARNHARETNPVHTQEQEQKIMAEMEACHHRPASRVSESGKAHPTEPSP